MLYLIFFILFLLVIFIVSIYYLVKNFKSINSVKLSLFGIQWIIISIPLTLVYIYMTEELQGSELLLFILLFIAFIFLIFGSLLSLLGFLKGN
ncbi:MAG: hypothetical protein JG770_1316 [Mahella sp.]|nr:hypothetical protein [Mahella sp.]